ncbi:MAG: amidohydrolase family protein [Desulfovibrio sp.]|nr:amidohydrolase family protein [Desulfovibrio sp.]
MLVPILEPARGAALYEPVRALENGVILADNDLIVAIGANLAVPPDYELTDFGDAMICPPLVNAHTHLQLSWLEGTVWGLGFTEWLKSMLPRLFPVIRSGFGSRERAALADAVACLQACGTGHAGDVGGSIPGALEAAAAQDLPLTSFCEWLGFTEDAASPWPGRCRQAISANPGLALRCAPCGHALYSTSVAQMRIAQAWCESMGRIFTFHLAESPEETEMLVSGAGPLAELYRGNVLPDNWQPPGLGPVRLALRHGLLKKGTLAVHCVQLEDSEIMKFAATGAAICLCPRSNRNLAVGLAPAQKLADAGILLCLGTDGLTSCEDLDVRNEARFLQTEFGLPLPALLRMAIPNGRAALGLETETLAAGKKARFSVWALGEDSNA